MSMKNSSDTIDNRTLDLPACSAVPEPTASPRGYWQVKTEILRRKTAPVTICPPQNLTLNILLLTYSRSRLFPQKLTRSPLVKKFYVIRTFITAFTTARHLSLSWARSIHPMPLHPISWRSILTLSSHLRLGLPSDLPSGFPTKTLYTPLFSTIRVTLPVALLFVILFFCR